MQQTERNPFTDKQMEKLLEARRRAVRLNAEACAVGMDMMRGIVPDLKAFDQVTLELDLAEQECLALEAALRRVGIDQPPRLSREEQLEIFSRHLFSYHPEAERVFSDTDLLDLMATMR